MPRTFKSFFYICHIPYLRLILFQIDYPTIKKDTVQFNSAQSAKQITTQQDRQYQEIGQITTKIKTGPKSNNNIDRLLSSSKTSRAQNTEKSGLISSIENKQANFDDYNSDNSGFQSNKHSNVGQDIKGQRICPILSGNSSLSSISSSFGNTNNSLNQNINFNTFTSVSNNPAISINGELKLKITIFLFFAYISEFIFKTSL